MLFDVYVGLVIAVLTKHIICQGRHEHIQREQHATADNKPAAGAPGDAGPVHDAVRRAGRPERGDERPDAGDDAPKADPHTGTAQQHSIQGDTEGDSGGQGRAVHHHETVPALERQRPAGHVARSHCELFPQHAGAVVSAGDACTGHRTLQAKYVSGGGCVGCRSAHAHY